jgi:hypothetical protein
MLSNKLVVIAGVVGWAIFSQPSYAAEYSFEFVLNGFTQIIEDFGDFQDPDDDVLVETLTPGPLLIGSGSLIFEDSEVSVPGVGNTLNPAVSDLSWLGSSAQFAFTIDNPTELNAPNITAADLVTSVNIYFQDGNEGAELMGVDFAAVGLNLGGGGRVAILDANFNNFSYQVEEVIPSIGFAGKAMGDGAIKFVQIEPSQLAVGSIPVSIPEPAALLGLAAVGAIATVWKLLKKAT